MKTLLMWICATFSVALMMCDSPLQTKSALNNKQKVKIYFEKMYAEIKADSVADIMIPQKKALELKLENSTANISETRKEYSSAFDKWNKIKQEQMNAYCTAISAKYNITKDMFNDVCDKQAREAVNNVPGKDELMKMISEN